MKKNQKTKRNSKIKLKNFLKYEDFRKKYSPLGVSVGMATGEYDLPGNELAKVVPHSNELLQDYGMLWYYYCPVVCRGFRCN